MGVVVIALIGVNDKEKEPSFTSINSTSTIHRNPFIIENWAASGSIIVKGQEEDAIEIDVRLGKKNTPSFEEGIKCEKKLSWLASMIAGEKCNIKR